MKKNLYFIFIAASFALLVASPGRLCYGLPLILELNLLTAGATAFNGLLKKIDLGNLKEILTLSFIVFLTILFKQILILYSPVVALTLSFVIFIPAASAFLVGSVFAQQTGAVSKNTRTTFVFSAFAFVFFFIRDVFGYGTISLPVPGGIYEVPLFDSYKTAFLSFFATVPGAMLLLVACLSLILFVQNKMNVIEKAGIQYDDN